MLKGLQSILDKEAVLSTVNADDLLHEPHKVEANYQRHVATFISMGSVSDFATRLIRRVMKAKTPKGMIVAPYGYGKTSTLGFLWHECEEQNLIAVPPFYCSNLLDILKATYGWTKYRLRHRQPSLVPQLESAYGNYTAATIEKMSERYSEEHGLARVTAQGLLQDMLEQGSLILKLTPSNLLFFLDEAAAIAKQAGYRGIVILPDEFQQYVSKGANLRGTIQEFREFIWGLDTRSRPLGVIISIPDTTEAGVIQEHGKDILHRLKKDDLYYRLRDIYSREFPAQLWGRYCEEFGLACVADHVVDQYTLRAIGQIIERDDLGEGPRTVVDSFKRAILCYHDQERSYTPIDLIDDFLESNIRFQAQADTIKRVTRQVLNSTVVDTPAKAQAIKLMAAFPRGCPIPVQEEYGAHETIKALSKQAHGELMTHLVEGYTLLGLQRGEAPTQTVDVMITRFWHGYDEDELHLEGAIRAFTNRLLPRFFERRRGAAFTGWGNLEFTRSVRGGKVAIIKGTFDRRFPHRNLALQVAYKEDHLRPLLQGADLQFDFLFRLGDHDAPGQLALSGERTVRFDLNMGQRVRGTLPSDIKKLQEFVNPEFVTPLLMLSLVDYFDRWEEIEEATISESDRSEIEFLITRLLNHTAHMLFSRTVAESLDRVLRNVGGRMLEELFNRRCAALFPDYHSLYVQAHHQRVIDAYVNAMRGMTLKERRGRVLLEDTKERLARRFGLGSVATFENRAKNEYADFMLVEQWAGRGDAGKVRIRLKLHPLEEAILEQIRASSTQRKLNGQLVQVLEANAVAEVARPLGYRDEETLLALQLLAARGYVRFDRESKLIYLTQVGPDPAELEAHLQKALDEIEKVPAELLDETQAHAFRALLTQSLDRLNEAAGDEEELDELQAQLVDVEQRLADEFSALRESLRQNLNNEVLELERAVLDLRRVNVLDRTVEGQVAFVMHLNELRQKLSDRRRRLVGKYEECGETLKQGVAQAGGGPVSETLSLHQSLEEGMSQREVLAEERQRLTEQVAYLERWIKLLQDTDRLFNALERTPDLQRELTREVIPQIQAHLAKERLDGLDAWETFGVKVRAVEQELEKRRRHGNERFGEVKQEYEAFLRAIDARNYRPTTRYTYGEDKGSYQDLYREVKTKVDERLKEIENDLEQNEVDLLKAKYIQELDAEHQPVVEQVEQQITEARGQLKSLRHLLTVSLIEGADEELSAYVARVRAIAEVVVSSREKLGPILYTPRELSEAEEDMLGAFGRRSNVDPTDLFVSMRQQGSDLEWQELVDLVDHLYRKNRILIRMSRRG